MIAPQQPGMDTGFDLSTFMWVDLGEILIYLSLVTLLLYFAMSFGQALVKPLAPRLLRGLAILLLAFSLCVSLAGLFVATWNLVLCFFDAGQAAVEQFSDLMARYEAYAALR